MTTAKDISKTFVHYLKEQGQEDQLGDIVTNLQEELYRNQDITVVTAVELGKEEHAALEKKLLDTWGEHKIIVSVDPSILSGLIVRFKDIVIDTSGKHQLSDLAQEFRS